LSFLHTLIIYRFIEKSVNLFQDKTSPGITYNRDRIADYSTYPLAEPDVQFSRIRLLCYYVCYLSA
jgi:hypothetical protein